MKMPSLTMAMNKNTVLRMGDYSAPAVTDPKSFGDKLWNSYIKFSEIFTTLFPVWYDIVCIYFHHNINTSMVL